MRASSRSASRGKVRSRGRVRWRVVLLTVALLAGVPAILLWWRCASMPGRSFTGAAPPANAQELELAARLREHVEALAGTSTRRTELESESLERSPDERAPIGERNLAHPQALAAAVLEVERRLALSGRSVQHEAFDVAGTRVRAENLSVELTGTTHASEIVLVGAHYDTAVGAPGANDNASGCAALFELARTFAARSSARTLRLVAFANEEPPYFATDEMGSAVCARACRARNENIVAMLSLETLGCFSDRAGSQHYPVPILAWIHPDRGDFVAFVGNQSSRELVQRCIRTFRSSARIASEGAALFESIPGVDWSDHRSFWANGYPALMLTDTAVFRDPNYHHSTDTPEKLDYLRLARVVLGLEPVLTDLLTAN